jgi:hypothetical protein
MNLRKYCQLELEIKGGTFSSSIDISNTPLKIECSPPGYAKSCSITYKSPANKVSWNYPMKFEFNVLGSSTVADSIRISLITCDENRNLFCIASIKIPLTIIPLQNARQFDLPLMNGLNAIEPTFTLVYIAKIVETEAPKRVYRSLP